MSGAEDRKRYEPIEVVTLAPIEFSADARRLKRYARHARVMVPRHIAERFAEDGKVVLTEGIKWEPKADPEDYMKKNPEGPNAELARVLVAFPDLLPKGKPSGSKEPSGDSSGPSES